MIGRYEVELDEETGREDREGRRVSIGIGASPCVVFSYRMATRLVSSLNDGLRTTGRLAWRTLPEDLDEGQLLFMMCEGVACDDRS